MCKRLLIIVAVLMAFSLSITRELQARGPSLVGITMHNFSSTGTKYDKNGVYVGSSPYRATNTDQICVFCHTPHGGSLDAPLWNRSPKASTGFTHYSSATLSSAGSNTTRAIQPASLMCLSCHDGSVGVGDGLLNDAGIAPDNFNIPVAYGPKSIGANLSASVVSGDLSDDHPISISYITTLAQKPTEFNDLITSPNADLPLFGGGKTVECSTCHDPHVNYVDNPQYRPFLAMSNAGSAMCLACHIK